MGKSASAEASRAIPAMLDIAAVYELEITARDAEPAEALAAFADIAAAASLPIGDDAAAPAALAVQVLERLLALGVAWADVESRTAGGVSHRQPR